jgi:hypothetical protein
VALNKESRNFGFYWDVGLIYHRQQFQENRKHFHHFMFIMMMLEMEKPGKNVRLNL